MDEFDTVAPFSSEYWEQEKAKDERAALLHGTIGDGLLMGPPLAKAFGIIEKARSIACTIAAAEKDRRAKEARAREEAQREREAQAERDRIEREKARKEKEDREASERNFRVFGVEKPVVEIGRDIPEPSTFRDLGNRNIA